MTLIWIETSIAVLRRISVYWAKMRAAFSDSHWRLCLLIRIAQPVSLVRCCFCFEKKSFWNSKLAGNAIRDVINEQLPKSAIVATIIGDNANIMQAVRRSSWRVVFFFKKKNDRRVCEWRCQKMECRRRVTLDSTALMGIMTLKYLGLSKIIITTVALHMLYIWRWNMPVKNHVRVRFFDSLCS